MNFGWVFSTFTTKVETWTVWLPTFCGSQKWSLNMAYLSLPYDLSMSPSYFERHSHSMTVGTVVFYDAYSKWQVILFSWCSPYTEIRVNRFHISAVPVNVGSASQHKESTILFVSPVKSIPAQSHKICACFRTPW